MLEETPPLFADLEKLHALDELFERSRQYRDSYAYAQTLRFIGRLTQYSPYNGFLISIQNPTATYVATPAKWWREFSRRVLPEASPLVILVPFGPVGFVYDLEDTVGPPLPPQVLDPFPVSGQAPQDAWDNLLAHCQVQGIALEFKSMPRTRAGSISPVPHKMELLSYNPYPVPHRLELNKKHSPEAQLVTLLHELAHLLCGHLGKGKSEKWDDRSWVPKDVQELEAESVAYLVAWHLGLVAESEKYLADFVGRRGRELPPISFHSVLTVAGTLEEWARKRPREKKANKPAKR